jgi:hypothetical protein
MSIKVLAMVLSRHIDHSIAYDLLGKQDNQLDLHRLALKIRTTLPIVAIRQIDLEESQHCQYSFEVANTKDELTLIETYRIIQDRVIFIVFTGNGYLDFRLVCDLPLNSSRFW